MNEVNFNGKYNLGKGEKIPTSLDIVEDPVDEKSESEIENDNETEEKGNLKTALEIATEATEPKEKEGSLRSAGEISMKRVDSGEYFKETKKEGSEQTENKESEEKNHDTNVGLESDMKTTRVGFRAEPKSNMETVKKDKVGIIARPESEMSVVGKEPYKEKVKENLNFTASPESSMETTKKSLEAINKQSEKIEEESKKIGAWDRVKKAGHWYSKQSLKSKLFISGGLIATASLGAFVGGATGIAIASAAMTGSIGQRALGGIATFMATEGFLKKRLENKLVEEKENIEMQRDALTQEGKTLSENQHIKKRLKELQDRINKEGKIERTKSEKIWHTTIAAGVGGLVASGLVGKAFGGVFDYFYGAEDMVIDGKFSIEGAQTQWSDLVERYEDAGSAAEKTRAIDGIINGLGAVGDEIGNNNNMFTLEEQAKALRSFLNVVPEEIKGSELHSRMLAEYNTSQSILENRGDVNSVIPENIDAEHKEFLPPSDSKFVADISNEESTVYENTDSAPPFVSEDGNIKLKDLNTETFDQSIPEQPLNTLYEVSQGDNLWKVIEGEMTNRGMLDNLDEAGRTHMIDEIKDKFSTLTSDQLKNAGISSGNVDLLNIEDKINLDVIPEAGGTDAEDMISRARGLSPTDKADIIGHGKPPSELAIENNFIKELEPYIDVAQQGSPFAEIPPDVDFSDEAIKNLDNDASDVVAEEAVAPDQVKEIAENPEKLVDSISSEQLSSKMQEQVKMFYAGNEGDWVAAWDEVREESVNYVIGEDALFMEDYLYGTKKYLEELMGESQLEPEISITGDEKVEDYIKRALTKILEHNPNWTPKI